MVHTDVGAITAALSLPRGMRTHDDDQVEMCMFQIVSSHETRG